MTEIQITVLTELAKGPQLMSHLDTLGERQAQGRQAATYLVKHRFAEFIGQSVLITASGRNHLAKINGDPDFAVAQPRQVFHTGQYVPKAWHTREGSQQAGQLPSLLFGKQHAA